MAALRGWNVGVSLWVEPVLFTRGMWEEGYEHESPEHMVDWECPLVAKMAHCCWFSDEQGLEASLASVNYGGEDLTG